MRLVYEKIDLIEVFGSMIKGLEVFFVLKNLKPVSRIELGDDVIKNVSMYAERLGLSVIISDFKFVTTKDGMAMMLPISSPMKGKSFVYFSKDIDKAIKAKEAETALDHETFGELLGYPPCCRKFFIQYYEDAAKMHDDYTLIALDASEFCDWHLNVSLHYFDVRIIGHFPCSFDCKHSLELAKHMYASLFRHNPTVASYLKKRLQTVVLYDDATGVHVFEGLKKNGQIFLYDKVLLTSPNPLYDVLKHGNNLMLFNKHQFKVLQDGEELLDMDEPLIGVLDFYTERKESPL